MDFEKKLEQLTQNKPPEVVAQLKHLGEHDDLLSLQGIIRVIEIFNVPDVELDDYVTV